MSPLIWGLSAVILPLPFAMVAGALLFGQPVLLGPAGFMGAIYLLIWLWFRPGRFEIAPSQLRIVWPVRTRSLELSSVEQVEIISSRALRDELGLLLRGGAGGLWGGFGMLWSSRGEHMDFYISRLSPLVLIRRRSGRFLLITPEQPERFVAALADRSGAVGKPPPL